MQKCESAFANHCIITMDFVTKESTELKSRPLYNLSWLPVKQKQSSTENQQQQRFRHECLAGP